MTTVSINRSKPRKTVDPVHRHPANAPGVMCVLQCACPTPVGVSLLHTKRQAAPRFACFFRLKTERAPVTRGGLVLPTLRRHTHTHHLPAPHHRPLYNLQAPRRPPLVCPPSPAPFPPLSRRNHSLAVLACRCDGLASVGLLAVLLGTECGILLASGMPTPSGSPPFGFCLRSSYSPESNHLRPCRSGLGEEIRRDTGPGSGRGSGRGPG